MPRYPQCPRCGDNLSELIPVNWYTPRGDEPPAVCSVCVADHKRETKEAAAADVQEGLRAAVPAGNTPAFPCYSETGPRGMSLRDYFAGQVIGGLLAFSPDGVANEDQLTAAEAATRAYRYADAMLAARQK